MVFCPQCKERWFNIKLRRDGEYCKRCDDKDRNKLYTKPFFYFAENALDFQPWFLSLVRLSSAIKSTEPAFLPSQ